MRRRGVGQRDEEKEEEKEESEGKEEKVFFLWGEKKLEAERLKSVIYVGILYLIGLNKQPFNQGHQRIIVQKGWNQKW